MAIPLSVALFKVLIKPFGWRFRVTQKGIYRSKVIMNWYMGIPLLALFAVTVVSIIYGFCIMHWNDTGDLFYFMFFWSMLRLFGIGVAIYNTFDFPQKRKAMRFKRRLACSFNGKKEIIDGTVIDISEYGVLLKYRNSLNKVKTGDNSIISIEDAGLMEIPIKFRRVCENYASVSFQNMPLDKYKNLVEFLYCRPGQWDYQNVDFDREILQAIKKALIFEGVNKNGAKETPISCQKEKLCLT